jgi:hypothetical protein
MNEPDHSVRPWPLVGPLRRYGPVLVIACALVAAGAVATVEARGTKQASSTKVSSSSVRSAVVPPTYATAARQGRTAAYRWSPECDRTTGRLKVPTVYAPPCVPVFDGNNRGSTWNGVSARSINVVYYQPEAGGLFQSVIQGATNTPTANLATARAYVEMFNHIFEMYGRRVNLIDYHATGAADDAVAAQADAVQVAQQVHAFASIGGPGQTSAYEDELARLHVLCVGCGSSATYGALKQNAPYIWADLPSTTTLLNTAASYVIDQLNGKPAIWAGNAAWHHRTREFVVVNEVADPPAPGEQQLAAQLTKRLTDAHVRFAIRHALTYTLDLSTLPQEAATLASKLKASNATTVVFAGDPIMPIYLTKACAKVGYFPEWLITGTLFTDTSTLGRYYDQSEWAHAFGISSLGVPTSIQTSEAYTLYRWWYGAKTTPPATRTAQVLLPALQQLFDGIELAGPHLTPSTFAAGLFRAPPAGGQPTTPLQAYGDQGAPPTPSYSSPADYTFIWYDPTARGPNEEGVEGTGLVRYVDGGERYKADTVPASHVPMFRMAGSVTSYGTNPAGRRSPSYPAWPGSPAGASSRS